MTDRPMPCFKTAIAAEKLADDMVAREQRRVQVEGRAFAEYLWLSLKYADGRSPTFCRHRRNGRPVWQLTRNWRLFETEDV